MGLNIRSGAFVLCAFSFFVPIGWAQQSAPANNTDANQTTSNPPSTSPSAGLNTTQTVQTQPPPTEPAVIEDGGISLEPIYWLNRAQPTIRGGATATAFGTFDFSGDAKGSIGGELGIPAGHSNTVRLSYFRVQGNAATSALSQDATYLGEAFTSGDYLVGSYTLQSVKISWDYLSYTWYKHSGKIRLKTLYELQYDTISATVNAPLAAVTTDSSGDTDYNIGHEDKNLVLPTLGLELEEALNKHFRWEVKASGFDIPHHADIGDVQGDIALHVNAVEVIVGGRLYHFKTSPQSDEYLTDTLSGAFVGLRYYWGRKE